MEGWDAQREDTHSSNVDGTEHKEDLVAEGGDHLGTKLGYDKVCSEGQKGIINQVGEHSLNSH